MGKTVITNAWVRLNNVDISDHVRKAVVNESNEQIDVTAMGAAGKSRTPGLADDKITLELYQDWASSSIDQTLAPLARGGSAFLVEVSAAGTAISATNPKWSGTCLLFDYTPLDASVGELALVTIDLPVNGTITRATA